jgi:glycine/D-amino acid oxidase-like deaminating enzyme
VVEIRLMMDSAPVVVVGAGIVGLCVATELVRTYPDHPIILIERSRPLEGASSYAGAGDLPLFWSPIHEDLIRRSWAWHDARSTGSSYRTRHAVAWFRLDPETRNQILDGAMPCHDADADAGMLDALRGSVTEEALSTAHASWGYRISTRRWGAALLSDLERHQHFTLLRAQVEETSPSSRHVLVRLADGSSISAAAAVITVGPWILNQDNSWSDFARERFVRTKRVYGLRARFDPSRRGSAVLVDAKAAVFAMPTGNPDELAMSIKHAEWDVPPGETILPPEVLASATRLLDEFTHLGPIRSVRTRVHADTYTSGDTPVVERIDGADSRLVVITGTHGSGVRLAPALAQDAVRLLEAHQHADNPPLERAHDL